MAEEEDEKEGMSFDDFMEGPGKLAGRLVAEFNEGLGPAEQMARAIEALPDALRFEALVSMCMEVGWTRAQLGRLPAMKKELGDVSCGLFAHLMAVVLDMIKDTGTRMKPADILAREDWGGAKEDGKGGDGL